ncbi:beta-lactamase-like protein [Amylostereum chailletii]|nr:beta-lactamase-like protein [Amylostereum chailletii]
MSQWMNVTFLGTSSGGGPSDSRNCSSLVLDIVGDGSLWMVDCAEGTLRQFLLQPSKPNTPAVKASRVTIVFITHMHADHIMGLVTLLRDVLGIHDPNGIPASSKPPKIELYGPAGLRAFVRSNLILTRTRTADAYVVHELLSPTDKITPCTPDARHSSEAPGRDLLCGKDGFWMNIATKRSGRSQVHVQAGPIIHRDPCIGYVFHELDPSPGEPFPRLPRKLVVLGDTSSPSALTPLIAKTPGPVSLLIHEATDAHIPVTVDPRLGKRSPALVQSKVVERGHSTPEQAGACAGLWGAERLVLNHIGARFPGPSHRAPQDKRRRLAVLHEMERQATEAWTQTACIIPGRGSDTNTTPARRAMTAYDFLGVSVPVQPLLSPPAGTS